MLLNENVKEGLSFVTRKITATEIKTIAPSGIELVPRRNGYYIVPIIGSIVIDSTLMVSPYSDSGLFYLIQSNDTSIIQSVLSDTPFNISGIYHNFNKFYTNNGIYTIEQPGLELRLLCDNYGSAGSGDIQISFAYYYQKAIE